MQRSLEKGKKEKKGEDTVNEARKHRK